MKRGWMRFWVSVSLLPFCAVMASAQAPSTPWKSAAAAHRANELTLARLQPEHDSIAKALRIYWKPLQASAEESTLTWMNGCQKQVMNVDVDRSRKVLSIRVTQVPEYKEYECVNTRGSSKPVWTTGHGLAIGDAPDRVLKLYGAPDSRSPSTKGGQQLELLYYAFDWAGPDVPQVMQVLCTPEKDGKPGQVVEITLAGPSL